MGDGVGAVGLLGVTDSQSFGETIAVNWPSTTAGTGVVVLVHSSCWNGLPSGSPVVPVNVW